MLQWSNHINFKEKSKKERGKYMIYYKNTGEDESDSLTIMPVKPQEDRAVLLVPEFEFLRKFDFKDFNYFNFEDSITDISSSEFEFWYSGVFVDWLMELDENYIDIDIENINSKFTSPAEKKLFLLKMVNFVMFLLPYQILRNVFKQSDDDFETREDLKKYLEDDTILINLRYEIIDEIDRNMTQFDSFIQTLLRFEKIAKKNLVEENINLLDSHTKKHNLFLEIFKGIMVETDMYKFKEYLTILFKNDWKNIV